MYRKILDKRGAIGETITWTAATLIILGILVIFLVLSSLLANLKVVNSYNVKSDIGDSPVLEVKTSIAQDINSENKEKIDETLKEWNNE